MTYTHFIAINSWNRVLHEYKQYNTTEYYFSKFKFKTRTSVFWEILSLYHSYNLLHTCLVKRFR